MITEESGFPYLQVIIKPADAAGNARCSYCFYAPQRAVCDDIRRIPADMLESYIRRHIEFQAGREITFTRQGGEPTLLSLDFFRRRVHENPLRPRTVGRTRPSLSLRRAENIL